MQTKFIFFALVYILCTNTWAQTTIENQMEYYFESIKKNPQRLTEFLYQLPKGGDLHSHASGATYAENMLRYAYPDNLCINRITYAVYKNPKCKTDDLLNHAIQDLNFKEALIDSWSMRHFDSKKESGHDHFFKTFSKFSLIPNMHGGEVLSEIAQRAGLQNEQYLELMVTADKNESGKLGKKLGWNADFGIMRDKLLQADFKQILRNITVYLNQDEVKMRSLLTCNSNHPQAGCQVKIRYLYQVLREQAPEMVFAQLLAGFEAANQDKRIVGLNMVQPEDGPVSMRDYKLHMQMIKFLHQYYPNVYISLHAGELNDVIVPPQGLTFHIHDAVMIAQTNRIGHGVDITRENDADQLLKIMAKKQIAIEINLSSNAEILNIEGKNNHPLPIYLNYGVPVVISTDDEGVSRSNLTKEYQLAVTTFQLKYSTIKQLIRNSLTYSFLPGKSLWKDNQYQQMVSECEKETSVIPAIESCKSYLHLNEKAQMQWELEKRFKEFESKFVKDDK